jgi:hypothetical protein
MFKRTYLYVYINQGFAVFEREEIERRMLYKSEYNPKYRPLKFILHLEAPAPNIVSTSLLAMISCLTKNETHSHGGLHPFKLFEKYHHDHDRKHVAVP